MDFIGVDEYYHCLPSISYPTLDQLIQAWKPIVSQLYNLSVFWNKTVVMTETAWASSPYGVWNKPHIANSSDLQTQSIRFEAILEAFGNNKSQEWFEGVFWWNWPTDPAFNGDLNSCATPSYKPAENVLRKYYRATKPIPKPPDFPPLCHCTE